MSRSNPETFVLPQAGGARRAHPGTRAAVIGGGIAGVAAATALCERGVDVTLLEREAQLGGRASGFSTTIATGERVEMERGFHAFFRQYYNLRALLRRIDPELALLQELDDYPILGPGGMVQHFAGLPKRTPWQLVALTCKTPHLRFSDIAKTNVRAALEMLRFDPERTYARFDATTAAAYLDSLEFPSGARRMLFDVFSHSFFNPESEMSAAELLMMFHFYMTGNREGLIFDVARRPMGTAIWEPFVTWLSRRGVSVLTATPATQVRRNESGGWKVEHAGGSVDADLLVLALDVGSVQTLIAASPALADVRPVVDGLRVTRPFAVWRLWLDRPMDSRRAPFSGTTGIGLLDNISLYDRFQEESARWAQTHRGSVVELHAYAVPLDAAEDAIKKGLLDALHAFFPEARHARVLGDHFLLKQDCPAFPPGSYVRRPGVQTALSGLAFAGDFVAMPIPCALMERAAASGFLAANTLLAPLGVAAEPIRSVPLRGLLSPLVVRGKTLPVPVSERREGAPGALLEASTQSVTAPPRLAEKKAGAVRPNRLRLFGRELPIAQSADDRPDWQQANPAWIRAALARSQGLASGGWYALDALRAIGVGPRSMSVDGRQLVVFRHGSRVLVAPDACPHLGASLGCGRVHDGRLVCPWHGLRLGPEGHGAWKPLPTFDDGILLWVRLDGNEPPTDAPILPIRPVAPLDAVVRLEAACEPRDVIANRLDPWHGTHFHAHSFGSLRVVEQKNDEVTVRVAYRVFGSLAVEVDARFHCPDPRSVVMTIVRGEGEGTVVETHATPLRPGRTAILEATLATSERPGFAVARRAAPLFRPLLRWASRRLWIDDAAYAERLYALRAPIDTRRFATRSEDGARR